MTTPVVVHLDAIRNFMEKFTPPTPVKVGFFGGKKALREENTRLREFIESALEQMDPGGEAAKTLESLKGHADGLATANEALLTKIEQAKEDARKDHIAAQNALNAIRKQVREAERELVTVQDTAMLQEVGIYEFRHDMESADEYKEALTKLRKRIRAKAKSAVDGSDVGWTVNGSKREGGKMIRGVSKLLLSCYNNEVDNAVAKMRPYKLQDVLERIERRKDTIERLGAPLGIAIDFDYHRLREEEMELAADWVEKKEQEKEEQRVERERLREERRAEKELLEEQKRLRAKLAMEQRKFEEAVLHANEEERRQLEMKLEELKDEAESVDYRLTHVRAGHVYVVSNIGSFGEGIVKIGMTRRLDPMDRLRELSGAAVPFRFDLHGMIFSEDAVELENNLHKHFADKRLNLVNRRKEFFRTTPKKVKKALKRMDMLTVVTEFNEEAPAEDWRMSENQRKMDDSLPMSSEQSSFMDSGWDKEKSAWDVQFRAVPGGTP